MFNNINRVVLRRSALSPSPPWYPPIGLSSRPSLWSGLGLAPNPCNYLGGYHWERGGEGRTHSAEPHMNGVRAHPHQQYSKNVDEYKSEEPHKLRRLASRSERRTRSDGTSSLLSDGPTIVWYQLTRPLKHQPIRGPT